MTSNLKLLQAKMNLYSELLNIEEDDLSENDINLMFELSSQFKNI
jgi:hypothetical protein